MSESTLFSPADIIPFVDFTRLKEDDSSDDLAHFCQQGVGQPIAAVCVYPRFLATAKKCFAGTEIRFACVANFPSGNEPLPDVLASIQQCIEAGANEIDIVMPYQPYLAGEREQVIDFIRACKKACGDALILKVILETGALQDLDIITRASEDMINAGADFLKTSTGFNYPGASLEAAKVMLNAIKTAHKPIGFKASGGIQSYEQALAYATLVNDILGRDKLQPALFRIGASRLLTTLMEEKV